MCVLLALQNKGFCLKKKTKCFVRFTANSMYANDTVHGIEAMSQFSAEQFVFVFYFKICMRISKFRIFGLNLVYCIKN